MSITRRGYASAFDVRVRTDYNVAWWRLVYAATPSYRFEREEVGPEPLPIEYEAEQAAIDALVAAGALER